MQRTQISVFEVLHLMIPSQGNLILDQSSRNSKESAAIWMAKPLSHCSLPTCFFSLSVAAIAYKLAYVSLYSVQSGYFQA